MDELEALDSSNMINMNEDTPNKLSSKDKENKSNDISQSFSSICINDLNQLVGEIHEKNIKILNENNIIKAPDG